jgi:hypothetical protein
VDPVSGQMGPAPGEPSWVGRCTVDTEQGVVGQAWMEQISKGTVSRAVIARSYASFFKLRVGGGAIAAVGDRATSYASRHSTEDTWTAQFLARREDVRWRGWREAEVSANSGWDRWSTLWNTRT